MFPYDFKTMQRMQSYAHCSWTLTFNQSLFSFSCKCVMIYAIFVSTLQIVVFHFLGFAFLWTSSILVIGFISATRNVFVQNLKQASLLQHIVVWNKNFLFSNNPITKYVLVAIHMSLVSFDHIEGCCCHSVDICNLQLAIMATRQKEKLPSHLQIT